MEKRDIGRRQFLGHSVAGAAAAGAGLSGAPGRRHPLTGKRVLIATGEFGESLETYCMLYRLQEEGVEAHIGAPRKKRLQLVVHDFEAGYDAYTEKPGYGIQVDLAYADVDPEAYDGLLIPGGRAPEEIRNDPHLVGIVAHFLKSPRMNWLVHSCQRAYAA